MLKIIVCVKVVRDPEAPVSTFKLDEAGGVAPSPGVPPVVNPYDENALEAALRIKETQPASITIVSGGVTVPKAVVRKCLAVGADELVVIEDPLFDGADSRTTAQLLAAAVTKLGEYDLILTGRLSADTNAGQVGLGLAELLGIPAVTIARTVEVESDTVRVERSLADGRETVEAALPCLVTVSHELGELRAANVKGLMAAKKQPVTSWQASDLGITTAGPGENRQSRLFIPSREVSCEMVEAETPEEAGASLAVKLWENSLSKS